MEVTIDFIVTLFKIAVLSSIYAFLIFWIFKFIRKTKPNSWFDKVSSRKLRFWITSGSCISVGLLLFLFTYWGFHGLGDGPRIPIGHGVIVDNTNWDEYGYIHAAQTFDGMKIEMTKFKVVNDKLIGNLESGFYDYKNSFFIFDLKHKLLTEFKTQKDFEEYAMKNKLPLSNELRTFKQNYSAYWGGWRFWLLP